MEIDENIGNEGWDLKDSEYSGKLNKGLFTSLKQNWKTPKKLYEELDKEFHFDFDPCLIDDKATMETNGLYIEWGKSNFVNPPYNQIDKWIAKAYSEYKKNKTIVLLIPSRTDTKWWHTYCMNATEIRFIKGRLCFNDNGKPAPFPSAVIIFDPKIKNEKDFDESRLEHNGLFD